VESSTNTRICLPAPYEGASVPAGRTISDAFHSRRKARLMDTVWVPFETTIALTRVLLVGVLAAFPDQLAGRPGRRDHRVAVVYDTGALLATLELAVNRSRHEARQEGRSRTGEGASKGQTCGSELEPGRGIEPRTYSLRVNRSAD
jgi:hypothetical protein